MYIVHPHLPQEGVQFPLALPLTFCHAFFLGSRTFACSSSAQEYPSAVKHYMTWHLLPPAGSLGF